MTDDEQHVIRNAIGEIRLVARRLSKKRNPKCDKKSFSNEELIDMLLSASQKIESVIPKKYS